MVGGAAGWTVPDPIMAIDHFRALAAIRRVGADTVELVRTVDDVEVPVPGSSDRTFGEATGLDPSLGPQCKRFLRDP